MENTGSQLGAFMKAVAFAADKHRHQRRKGADASPYINHPIALANVLANKGGVDDATVLCVRLADKICNLRYILASPPADSSAERKQIYFDWAARVVAGLRGVHPALESVFDGLYARWAELV